MTNMKITLFYAEKQRENLTEQTECDNKSELPTEKLDCRQVTVSVCICHIVASYFHVYIFT